MCLSHWNQEYNSRASNPSMIAVTLQLLHFPCHLVFAILFNFLAGLAYSPDRYRADFKLVFHYLVLRSHDVCAANYASVCLLAAARVCFNFIIDFPLLCFTGTLAKYTDIIIPTTSTHSSSPTTSRRVFTKHVFQYEPPIGYEATLIIFLLRGLMFVLLPPSNNLKDSPPAYVRIPL